MKRWKKIGLGAVLTLSAAAVGLGVWQRENLRALYTFVTTDSETLSGTLQDKQQAQQETLEKEFHITVAPPSIDISNDLLDGKLSAEEAKDALGITQVIPQPKPKPEPKPTPKPSPSAPAPAPQPEAPAPPQPEPPAPEPPLPEPELTDEQRTLLIQEQVNLCVAELYACEVDLMAQLGQMKQAAIDQWVALPPGERTAAKKSEIGLAGLDACYKLEVVVDDRVDAILSRYETPIRELGGDTAVLDELWRYYCDKKADQKAYYMDKYLD